jgi:uncharacterized protein
MGVYVLEIVIYNDLNIIYMAGLKMTFMIKPVSNACDMRCGYCFYDDVAKHRSEASHGFMTRETAENLVRKALGYARTACTFAFQGGEPTLAGLDFYEQFIGFQKKYNGKKVSITNTVQTNGYGINARWADFFAKNGFLVGLSIDGTKAIHDRHRKARDGSGTYERTVKAAKMLSGHKVGYNVLCVIGDEAAAAPEAVYNELKRHKYLQFIPRIAGFGEGAATPNPVLYADFLIKTFDMYYKDFMRGRYVSIRNFDNYIGILAGRPAEQCGMAGFCTAYFLVEADGGVYPCDFYVLDERKMGNVNDDSFRAMANGVAAKRFVEESKQADENCVRCRWFGLCRGGCRRYREPMIDGKLRLNTNCEAFKAFFEHSYEKMMEIVKKITYTHANGVR